MQHSSRPDFGGVAAGALAIVLVSTSLGLLVNHFSRAPLPVLVKAEGGELPLPPGVAGVSLAEARQMYDAGEPPLIDARKPDRYQAGHIPGALNLPADDFETRYLALAEKLEAAPALVVYCESADCGEALATVDRLKEAYPGQLKLFVGGWQAWEAAKYPARKGDAP